MIPSPVFKQRRRSGVAIVLVLSILVLLTVVVVAFFTNATTDLSASKSYSDGLRVKLLANSAVTLVESQIKSATQGGTSGSDESWSSQPGAIRTYGLDGEHLATYKLFSSDALKVDEVVNGVYNLSLPGTTDKEIPPDWNTRPADFVDLNSPSVTTDAAGVLTARFPIIDGNNLVKVGSSSVYDGIVPGAPGAGGTLDGLPDIEGFSVNSPTNSYKPGSPLAPNNNPVPMPVRWMYVLKDGQLQVRDPSDPTGGAIRGASKANPVVGRVAFWTDDDTSKLNINTASEGTPWTRPWAKAPTEIAFSTNIPAQNEFQGFQGHPAKTALSTVFGALWPVPGYVPAGTTDFVPSLLRPGGYKPLLPYYDLTPRVTESLSIGSAGATQPTSTYNTNTAYGVQYDGDRLYTTVDELMFNSRLTTDQLSRQARNVAQPDTTSGGQAYTIPPITPQYLEAARFFLTASNRAPEVTLLNTPRLGLWPIQSNANTSQTAKDKLLAFCSTIPGGSTNTYSFQRASVFYRDGSRNPNPNPSSDSSTADMAIARNITLYQYLQRMTSAKVPGLGGSFLNKYGSRTNQILTEVVDQIRSTMNLYQPSPTSLPRYDYTQGGQVVPSVNPANTTTRGFGRFSTIVEAALTFVRCDDPAKKGPTQIGAVLILQPFNPAPGFSSIRPCMEIEVSGLDQFTIQKTGDLLYKESRLGFAVNPQGNNGTNIVDAVDGAISSGNTTEYCGLYSQFYYSANGNNNARKTFTQAASGNDATFPFYSMPSTAPVPATGKVLSAGQISPQETANDTFDLNPDGRKDITIKIYSHSTATPPVPRALIQTITMTFPTSVQIPLPVLGRDGNGIPLQPVPTDAVFTTRRIDVSDGQPSDPMAGGYGNINGLISKDDRVRSVVVDINGPSKGDYRLIAGLSDVARENFVEHPFYHVDQPGTGLANIDPNPGGKAINWRYAHSLRTGMNPGWGTLGWYQYAGSTDPYLTPGYGFVSFTRKSTYAGTLVANLPAPNAASPPYYPEAFPAVPIGLSGATLTGVDQRSYPGDWDTGNGQLEDGPYIGKPDEGSGFPSFAFGPGYATTYHNNSIYYSRSPAQAELGQTYAPNRTVSSAIIFGSLPTGIEPAGLNVKPWQTLLFCANPAAGEQHPGFGISANLDPVSRIPLPPFTTIPDHYIMDLFVMPIVEPYAVSEPLSTQGKVNMNYQIAPFTYIHRNTGLRAVLKGARLMAIPSTATALQGRTSYKSAQGTPSQYRYSINPNEQTGTLKGFEDRFNSGDLFRSASEICNLPLVPSNDPNETYDVGVPKNPSYSSLNSFWQNCRLTGDNVREEPYGDLYQRLTTKSNTFTVHVRAQTLKKALTTSATTFVDPSSTAGGAKDAITAEYRGSFQVERYVDPNPAGFPDYATAATAPINNFYKFHTIGAKQF